MPTRLEGLAFRVRMRAKAITAAILGRVAFVVLRVLRKFDADRVSDFAGRFLRVLGPWLPEHRVGRANLKAAFPEKSAAEIEQILHGVWENLGRVAGEFVHFDRLWNVDFEHMERGRIELSPETISRFEALRDDGKPALVFTAHLANWELPALASAFHGVESAVIFRRPNVADVDRLVNELRSVNMGTLIPAGLDAPVRAAYALERGVHVGMLVDQYFHRGVEVTFFGRRTLANPLLARLARQIDCPVHGTRAIRLPNHRFRLELTEATTPARDSDGKIDVAGTMQVITSIIEGWIREYPEQWLWLHRRWRSPPDS
jgi:Kdo2-lipid IVA lauroyltransferase/acyltransferase